MIPLYNRLNGIKKVSCSLFYGKVNLLTLYDRKSRNERKHCEIRNQENPQELQKLTINHFEKVKRIYLIIIINIFLLQQCTRHVWYAQFLLKGFCMPFDNFQSFHFDGKYQETTELLLLVKSLHHISLAISLRRS